VDTILYSTIPYSTLNSVEIPTRCSFVIGFIIPKFIEGSTFFEWHTARHQELCLQHLVYIPTQSPAVAKAEWEMDPLSHPFPTQPWQQLVTTWVYKPDAANTAPDDERCATRKMLSLQ